MADLFDSCLADMRSLDVDAGLKTPQALKEQYCARCKNPECDLAKRAKDKFTLRNQTQLDRLFNPQAVSDNKQPQYTSILDFIDVSGSVDQVEVWSSAPRTSEPTKVRQAGDDPSEPGNFDEGEEQKEDWRDRYYGPADDPLPETGPDPDPEPRSTETQTPVHNSPVTHKPGNTDVSAGGIMLPDEPPPAPITARRKIILDPWTSTTSSDVPIVGKGAKIKMNP